MTLTLRLPEPPSRRREDALHWAARARLVWETKRDIWRAAIDQHTPFADPPQVVRVSAHFRLWNLDDGIDNSRARMKRILDALKQNQPPKDDLSWRLAPNTPASWITRGYLFDDTEACALPGEITQTISRKDRGVTVTVEAVSP